MNTSKLNKKVILLIMFTIISSMLISTMFQSAVYAETKSTSIKSSKIPFDMQPGSVIKYLNSSEYQILEGGNATISKSKKAFRNEESLETPLLEAEEYPTPEKDMIVYYGDDGEVNEIDFPTKQSEMKFNTLPSKQEAKLDSLIESNEISTKANSTLIAKWGSYPNKLYKENTSYFKGIYGTGRATVYGDTTGQASHKLKKGDIATKQKYDNCKTGKSVDVWMVKKGTSSNKTVVCKKWDVGGMPNAVVDIWKTGIEYWGYKYSSSSLKNWAKGASYKHK